ncbi:Peptidase M6-like, domain protein [Cordyceps fumosorosea ARSEF 2679]|uniref:Peptidase M6-like, domain protein n=1 Tax=Cordyceps fumosorosea (strain ARSEF 2679) TaxID=1081104 RepID=A0A167V1I4_CORFA|nr:Peptidase M6-like, domain protein [Cordyceps fumosorosea ARSEF 2679]OAA62123.1 Peptidase M6-like, domain protein [Cordyceps fumosorosea ARSEF 2679]
MGRVSRLFVVALSGTAALASVGPQHVPFQPIDPQNWVNPDDMTWADWKAPPGANWNDPSRAGSDRNFNIALVAVDYDNLPFVVTGAPNSTVFGNPLPGFGNVQRKDVPSYYHDLLNKPTDLNRGHTIHEYWMESSGGRFGVDLTAFGPYQMPAHHYQYGITRQFNPGACPANETCNLNLRNAVQAAWSRDVGNDTTKSFDMVFILSAGQDESSTWQEFGEMKFGQENDVPDAFGPPPGSQIPNFAATRYVSWTSWASASSLWPDAAIGLGSSVQCESSGMATYAHELSHLIDIWDNYNNPYGVPPVRSYTGPWSMMSRGTFNGPGGPHTRWQIPALKGGAMGSQHTVRDKLWLGLVAERRLLNVSKATLQARGPVVARLAARNSRCGLIGLRVDFDRDLSPGCSVARDPLCDGGGYDAYDVEVVDRSGSDSFQADAGVMFSKVKYGPDPPFQWTIDANPQDIRIVDFVRPNGTTAMITVGDYRQLLDALFHTGTNSGSKFEHVDRANSVHLYVLEHHRSGKGALSYTVAARALNDTSGNEYAVEVSAGSVLPATAGAEAASGVFCSFNVKNNGTQGGHQGADAGAQAAPYLNSDIYRLSATVAGSGWEVQLPNEIATAQFGQGVDVLVAARPAGGAAAEGIVTLRVTSESNSNVVGVAECKVTGK